MQQLTANLDGKETLVMTLSRQVTMEMVTCMLLEAMVTTQSSLELTDKMVPSISGVITELLPKSKKKFTGMLCGFKAERVMAMILSTFKKVMK